jgi:hypothetical protein
VRLGLVVTQPFRNSAASSIPPQSRRQLSDDERSISVPISREMMRHRRTGRRAAALRAYGFWRDVLVDLRQAERALALIEEAGPDPERQRFLAAIRTAREQLETFL